MPIRRSLRSQIESLWFEQGAAADAAAAANKHLARVKWVSPARVREIWAAAQKKGRLPPLHRPENGFSGRLTPVLQAIKQVQGKVA